MRRRGNCTRNGTDQGFTCSTWQRWLKEKEDHDKNCSTTEEEKRESGTDDKSVEGNSSDETVQFLRKEDGKEHSNRRRSVDWTLRDHTKQQRWNFSPGNTFDYLGSTLSDVRGDSVSSNSLDSSEHPDMVDEFGNNASGGDDVDVDLFEEEFEDVVQQYARTVYNKPVSGIHKYISSLIVPDGHNGVYRAVQEFEELITRFPPKHWYIFSSHGDHLHVSHICPNTNESCRCQWLQRSTAWARYGRRRLRRVTRASQLEPIDFYNILRYLSKAPRFVHGVGGFAEDVGLCNRYKHLSVRIKTIFIRTTFEAIKQI
jgi:hypothetical protein